MIRNILLLATVIVSTSMMAQTFDLKDHNDNSISGTNHAEYGNGTYLSSTKFHVENTSGASASYTADVQEIDNPTGAELQVCYGTSCYTANDGVATVQQIGDQSTVAAGATDNTFKVAPFGFGWSVGDSAVWKVIVRNVADANDTTVATVKWKNGTTSVQFVEENKVELNAYPNPVSDVLTVNYDVDGVKNSVLSIYNVLGEEVVTRTLGASKGKEKIDVNSMNSGVYFYAIKSEGKAIKTERFIVK
ncbi:MAG: T9SS type A sorting domain-containing protein [Vicingaceae bacterium]